MQIEFDFKESTKRCSRCRVDKDFSAFNKYKSGSFGLQNYCRECAKAKYAEFHEENKHELYAKRKLWRKENPEKSSARNKRYYARHADKRRAYASEYQRKHWDRVSVRMEKYRRENSERIEVTAKAYRIANKEKTAALDKAYRLLNRGKILAIGAKRRAAKRNATVSWADHKRIEEIYSLAAELTKTTGIRYEVDHIVPLISNLVCGLHWEGSMQIISSKENIIKGNRWWPDMPEAE